MNATQKFSSISPDALQQLIAASARAELLDVRTPAEFQSAHVPGARLLPLADLDPKAFLASRSPDAGPLYVLCQSGARAARAVEQFHRAGFEDCVLVEGGTQAWIDAGLPVVQGGTTGMSIIRQVQITVGFLCALGAGLALFVHPLFAVVPLFMGCGLLFAGLSGTCALALLLAKMPWNRLSAGSGKLSCAIPAK
jgi:rhodanese-related sulfurtransferase